VQPGNGPDQRSRQLIAKRRALAENNIGAVDKDRIRVVLVLGQRLRLWGRLRVLLGRVVPIFVVMVVTIWTVVMVAVLVWMGRSTVRVKMRTKIVSGGFSTAV